MIVQLCVLKFVLYAEVKRLKSSVRRYQRNAMAATTEKKPTEDTTAYSGVLWENDCQTADGQLAHDFISLQVVKEHKTELIWTNIAVFVVAHFAALYGIYLIPSARMYTTIFAFATYLASGIGITAGVHRLWSHKSYKASLGVRVLLTFLSTVAYENSVIHWAREHRVHHKYSETDADPVNSKRGFFFCHMGWLMCKKHPDVAIKGAGIDISDLTSDPVLAFQKKYYFPLMVVCAILLPLYIPVWGWNESMTNSFYISVMLRWLFGLHCTWLINSAAHFYGDKPYDKRIKPTNNRAVSMATFGEGSHNYHHVFPWDYKTSELGGTGFNATTDFIDFCAKFGWVWDRRTVSDKDMIRKRVIRTGDGTHVLHGGNAVHGGGDGEYCAPAKESPTIDWTGQKQSFF